MNCKLFTSYLKKVLLTLLFSNLIFSLQGQESPLYPISCRVFNPFLYNPAIAGSKDFLSLDFIYSNHNQLNSQILSGNTRLTKSQPGFYSADVPPVFSKIGVGGYIFNDLNSVSRNLGIGGTVSYHLQTDKEALSFFSFGISLKALINYNPGDTSLGMSSKYFVNPKSDVGIYYYTPNLFVGLSTTNLPIDRLYNQKESDSANFYSIPVSSQLLFQIGYKFTLIKSLNVVLEPSLMLVSDYSFNGKLTDHIKPGLKLYADNFSAGTYFYDYSRISVFFQFKFPRFYIGSYIEIPKNTPLYKNHLLVELTAGINLSSFKSGILRNYHW